MNFRLPYVTPWVLKRVMEKHPGCVWSAPTTEKKVALTFDDGPSAKVMPNLLAALSRQGVPATFFVLGDRLDGSRPQNQQAGALLEEAFRNGHEVAYHGLRHRSLIGLPAEALRKDIQRQRELIEGILGKKAAAEIRFFRPPFGRTDETVLSVLREEGLMAVNGNIVPGDLHFPKGWSETPRRAVARILRELQPGSIICLHAGEDVGRGDQVYSMESPARLVEWLVPELLRRGYKVGRLSEMIPSPVVR